MEALINSNLDW